MRKSWKFQFIISKIQGVAFSDFSRSSQVALDYWLMTFESLYIKSKTRYLAEVFIVYSVSLSAGHSAQQCLIVHRSLTDDVQTVSYAVMWARLDYTNSFQFGIADCKTDHVFLNLFAQICTDHHHQSYHLIPGPVKRNSLASDKISDCTQIVCHIMLPMVCKQTDSKLVFYLFF